MMIRTIALSVGLLCPAIPPARAEMPMMCARPEVLDRVIESLRAQGSRANLLPGDIGQVPGTLPHTVRCAVRLQQFIFDTTRLGPVPEWRVATYGFTVRQGRNGLFVDPAPPPPWLDGTGP